MIVCAAVLLAAGLLCGCLGGSGPDGETTATPAPAEATVPGTGGATPTPPSAVMTFSQAMADRSPNWAGYAVQTSFDTPESDAVDAVEASWNVPAVDCSLSSGDYASAFWVGIDGISSESVEQIGTESDCIGGVPQYYAWYEVFPEDSVNLDIEISPGDEVTARVEHMSGNTFRYTLRDLTTNRSVSVTHQSRITADRSSAEWIAEAPTDGRNRLLPLADFSPVEFRNASATVNGRTGPISGQGWQYQLIIMESRGGSLKATPSALTAGGTTFSITWDHV